MRCRFRYVVAHELLPEPATTPAPAMTLVTTPAPAMATGTAAPVEALATQDDTREACVHR